MTDICAACRVPSEAARCEHCGAARAPGGYVVEQLVAQTAHSRMYRAIDSGGQAVAVKELLFALVPGAAQLDAFDREAQLLSRLDDPRVPKFIASFREGTGVGTRLYLVQQFIEGESLADRVERRRFEEKEAKDVARQVLSILRTLHERGEPLLHRDLKPANIIQQPDGRLVLVDFGSARSLDDGMTHRSTLVGTFGYMPPEQLGGTVDATSDLYALGATLVHLITGRAPSQLAGPDLQIDVARHVNASPAFVAWLSKMTSRRPQDRFPSAREALDALDRPLPQAALKPATNKAAVTAALAGGVVALGGVASVLLLTTNEQQRIIVPSPVTPPSVERVAPPAPPPAPPPEKPSPPAPGKRKTAFEATRLERVQAPGARRDFWLESSFELTPALPLGKPAVVRASCSGLTPQVRLDRVVVKAQGADTASLAIEFSLEDGEARCASSTITAVGEKTLSSRGPRRELSATGPNRREWALPFTDKQVRIHFDTASGVGVLVDLEKQVVTPL